MNRSQIAIPTDDGRVFYDMTETDNPCTGCAGCCRHFRVSCYHGELDTQPGGYVPAELTTQVTPFRVCMKGTETGGGRCVALQDDLRCSIYTRRPSVCREFSAFMPDGSRSPECARLRAMFGVADPADIRSP